MSICERNEMQSNNNTKGCIDWSENVLANIIL